jgi:hypothetical protein
MMRRGYHVSPRAAACQHLVSVEANACSELLRVRIVVGAHKVPTAGIGRGHAGARRLRILAQPSDRLDRPSSDTHHHLRIVQANTPMCGGCFAPASGCGAAGLGLGRRLARTWRRRPSFAALGIASAAGVRG